MPTPKGWPSQEKERRTEAQNSTIEPIREKQYGLTTLSHQFVREIGTDAVEAGSTVYIINATGHSVLHGDVIRFTSGALSGQEVKVSDAQTNSFTLAESLSVAPSAADTFQILRHKYPRVNDVGAVETTAVLSPSPIYFVRDGLNQTVTEDTITPVNNRPLPVKLQDFSGDMVLNAANLNLEVQLDHNSASPDSVQIGDGTETVAVNVSKEMQVRDDDLNTSLSSIDGKITTCDTGSVTIIAELPAGTNNIGDVDVVSSVLPTGAATEATLSSIDGKITVCNTGDVTIGSAIPAGTNNIGDVDVVSSVLPTGAATEATLGDIKTASQLIDDAISTDGGAIDKIAVVGGYDGSNTQAITTDADGHLQIDVLSGGGGGVEYTEGDTDATITGKAILWEDAADTLSTVSAAKPLPIDVISSLPAGDNNIGNVDVVSSALPTGAATEATLSTIDGKITACNTGNVTIGAALPAGANNIGDVDVVSSALPTGAATEATLATLATEATVATLATEATVATLATEATVATLATEATLADIKTATQLIDDIVTTDGGALGKIAVVGGYDGANTRAIAVDASGNVQVDIVSGGGSSNLDVKDFIDTNPVLDTSSINIPASSGNPVQVVASLAADIYKIHVNDTTGKFIGVYTGAALSEVLQCIIGPGMDNALDVIMSSGERVSLRHMSDIAISTGELCIQFLG